MKLILKQIETCNSFSRTKELIKEHFPTTRKYKGSSRIVIPLNDKLVLKVAYNEKGIYQNQTEYDIYRGISPYYKRYLARVHKFDYEGTWLIQTRVKCIRDRYTDISHYSQYLYDELRYSWDLCIGDLNQLGRIGKRVVLYDYGATTRLIREMY